MEARKLNNEEKRAIGQAYDIHDRDEFLKRMYQFIDERVEISVDYVVRTEAMNRQFLEDIKRFKDITQQK